VRRSGLAWWAVAVVLAVVTGTVVRGSLDRSAAAAARFGHVVPVPVVADAVEVGDVVEAGDVRIERRPSAMVPVGELADLGSVGGRGRVALVPLVPGEVLLASKLAADGLRGAAALLPDGMRALAVPGGPGGRPPLQIGDRVDVLATTTAAVEAVGVPTVVVAEAALVLAVDEASDTVTIAVAVDDAPAVAYAVTAASVTLALTGPGRGR
jgi:pilus assembly protein CpaB